MSKLEQIDSDSITDIHKLYYYSPNRSLRNALYLRPGINRKEHYAMGELCTHVSGIPQLPYPGMDHEGAVPLCAEMGNTE